MQNHAQSPPWSHHLTEKGAPQRLWLLTSQFPIVAISTAEVAETGKITQLFALPTPV